MLLWLFAPPHLPTSLSLPQSHLANISLWRSSSLPQRPRIAISVPQGVQVECGLPGLCLGRCCAGLKSGANTKELQRLASLERPFLLPFVANLDAIATSVRTLVPHYIGPDGLLHAVGRVGMHGAPPGHETGVSFCLNRPSGTSPRQPTPTPTPTPRSPFARIMTPIQHHFALPCTVRVHSCQCSLLVLISTKIIRYRSRPMLIHSTVCQEERPGHISPFAVLSRTLPCWRHVLVP
ncbi:hypothetical protein FIBSPDRAFT_10470 [Athelia psychrophila]|uniref:Uncharacterized protein n=1 Tax=Athelia psychrophila TaxID=1759441 RepID=A0A166X7U8_9AGAM|nr:hypothetical protein FIBSPDRAFT_10470 [Fibularhizoctonia sp. CBS 109695]